MDAVTRGRLPAGHHLPLPMQIAKAIYSQPYEPEHLCTVPIGGIAPVTTTVARFERRRLRGGST